MMNIGHGIIYQMHDLNITVSAYINDMVVSTEKYTICSLCILRFVPDDFIRTIAC